MEVSEIVDAIDIVEYIGQYVDLEQKGREYWGLSCFKEENTPSFSVDPEKKVFADFSSGISGNLIEFVVQHDKVSVSQAINILKKYAGIKDDDAGANGTIRLEATKIAKKYRDRIRHTPVSTAKPLPSNIMSQYEFRRDKLQLWADEGITFKTMFDFGVRYDAFDDRIVYPIKDFDGNIISVSGRTCDPNWKEKKLRKYTYLQSIGSLNTIYNISDSLDDVIAAKELLIFEGAKSCMKAYDWDYRNCGALLTSHLSLNQMKYLIKLCSFNNVVLVFALDSDVDIRKDETISKLRKYARVEWVKNYDNLLGDKESPVDRGLEVWEQLYMNRIKLY